MGAIGRDAKVLVRSNRNRQWFLVTRPIHPHECPLCANAPTGGDVSESPSRSDRQVDAALGRRHHGLEDRDGVARYLQLREIERYGAYGVACTVYQVAG